MEAIKLIHGGQAEDHRGKLVFVNDFDMTSVKRFYSIEHFNTDVVRAWQGHQKEQKWLHVVEGSFLVVLVKPDDWINPSANLPYEEFVLKASEPVVLHIPRGFANGFKALTASSKLMVFSNFTLDESGSDNFRFDSHFWYNWKR